MARRFTWPFVSIFLFPLTMRDGWPSLIYRDVASLSLTTYWFRKVPQSGEEYQHSSYDSTIRAVGCCCLNYRYSIILEIWMILAPRLTCHILLLAFIFISAMVCVSRWSTIFYGALSHHYFGTSSRAHAEIGFFLIRLGKRLLSTRGNFSQDGFLLAAKLTEIAIFGSLNLVVCDTYK